MVLFEDKPVDVFEDKPFDVFEDEPVEAEEVEDEFVGAEEAEEGVFLVLELVDKVFVDKLDGDALLFVEAEFEDMVTWFDFNLILRFVAS